MVAVPALFPVTTPELASTEATVPSLVLHIPPLVLLLNGVANPLQIVEAPLRVGTAGVTFTVMGNVAVGVPHPLLVRA